jgi:hypothetical protein
MDGFGAAANDRDYGAGEDSFPSSRLDDRRTQIRACRRWFAVAQGRLPSIDQMDMESLTGPNGLLLDLRSGRDNPEIASLGDALARESGREGLERVADVPAESLLWRITSHYRAVLDTCEPITFEGEQIARDGRRMLYRAILLPLSENGDRIDFVAGKINWREFAGSEETAAIAFEVGRSLAFFQAGSAQPGFPLQVVASNELAHPELPLGR